MITQPYGCGRSSVAICLKSLAAVEDSPSDSSQISSSRRHAGCFVRKVICAVCWLVNWAANFSASRVANFSGRVANFSAVLRAANSSASRIANFSAASMAANFSASRVASFSVSSSLLYCTCV